MGTAFIREGVCARACSSASRVASADTRVARAFRPAPALDAPPRRRREGERSPLRDVGRAGVLTGSGWLAEAAGVCDRTAEVRYAIMAAGAVDA